MTLTEITEIRLKIKALEAEKETASLFEKCDIEDEILELRKQIGDYQQYVRDNPEDCEACGA